MEDSKESEAMIMIQPISFQTTASPQVYTPAAGVSSAKNLTGTEVSQNTQSAAEKTGADKKNPLKDMEDVVAVSEYGDTVQVSKKGQERFDREIASLKEDDKDDPNAKSKNIADQKEKSQEEKISLTEQKENPFREAYLEEMKERAAEAASNSDDSSKLENASKSEDSSNKDSKISNLSGYTSSQLQQMYLQGKISRNDYEAQVEQKKELLAKETETSEQNSKENAGNISKLEEAGRTFDAIDRAYSPDSSDTLSSEQKMDILGSLTGEKQTANSASNQQNVAQQQAFLQWQHDFQFLLA